MVSDGIDFGFEPKEERYIGIENEFTTFSKGTRNRTSFRSYFPELRANVRQYLLKGNLAIRAADGNAYYVDGDEIEVCTPPIAINGGFASRLTNSLLVGRNTIEATSSEIVSTGYSMHWNLSGQGLRDVPFYHGIIVPFQLFGLNPLSSGMNMRIKNEDSSLRFEILGDHIQDPNTVRALALILGAYTMAIEREPTKKPPLALCYNELYNNPYSAGRQRERIPTFERGRATSVPVIFSTNDQLTGEITAQRYMELFYAWIEPFVRRIATGKEVKNLEGYITGENALEWDKEDVYKKFRSKDVKRNGRYATLEIYPETVTDDNKTEHTTVLQRYNVDGPSKEGRFLGEIVRKHNTQISDMTWTHIHSSFQLSGSDARGCGSGYDGRYCIQGIDKIMSFGASLCGTHFYRPSIITSIKANDIEKIVDGAVPHPTNSTYTTPPIQKRTIEHALSHAKKNIPKTIHVALGIIGLVMTMNAYCHRTRADRAATKAAIEQTKKEELLNPAPQSVEAPNVHVKQDSKTKRGVRR